MFQNISSSKTFMHRRGILRNFVEVFFVPPYRKTCWGQTSVFQETSGIDFLIRRGEVDSFTIFCRKFVALQYRETSYGSPSVFEKVSD